MISMVKFRRTMRVLHRDIGYMAIGLTIVFSISGITLSHNHDWNSNYSVEHSHHKLSLLENLTDEQIVQQSIQQLKITSTFRTLFWGRPGEVKLFFTDDLTVNISIPKQTADIEKIENRFLLHRFNQLHLGQVKAYWVVISDVFAGVLIFLSISALFIVKGKKGVWGRGGIFTLIGILIPLVYMFVG